MASTPARLVQLCKWVLTDSAILSAGETLLGDGEAAPLDRLAVVSHLCDLVDSVSRSWPDGMADLESRPSVAMDGFYNVTSDRVFAVSCSVQCRSGIEGGS